MKKIITKKALSIAMITGLVAVPSAIYAQVSTDDSANNNEVVATESTDDQSVLDDSVTQSANDDTNTTTDGTTNVPVEAEAELPAGSVTLDQAKAIAQAKFPDKTIVKVEIKNEEGSVVYRIKFSDSVKVDVLASDGTIVKTMAEKNQSGLHRQDGVNRHNDNDEDDEDEVESESRGRSGSNSGRH